MSDLLGNGRESGGSPGSVVDEDIVSPLRLRHSSSQRWFFS